MKNLLGRIRRKLKMCPASDTVLHMDELTCSSEEDIRAERKGWTYFLSQGSPVNTADLRLGNFQTDCDLSHGRGVSVVHCIFAYLDNFKVALDFDTTGSRGSQYQLLHGGYMRENE